MTITQNVATKLFVGFVAVSMLFSLSFSPAKAATAEEMQAQIAALLAQVSALQGQLGGGTTSTGGGVCPFTWTRDLTLGASGDDVMKLQSWIIANGGSIPAGATGYFGAQTQAALAAWQSANAISPAAGYFGPITRAKVNSMCVTGTPMPSDDDANDDADMDDDANDDGGDLEGEASLDTVDLKNGDDTDIEEGQEDAPVVDVDVEFTDGDAKITRMDVELLASGSEEDPWDTFEDVSLWVDGEEVARMAADDEDEYLDEDDGTLRFSGLDIVAREDEEVTITIGVTVAGSVDDLDATWNVGVNAIRFIDGDDVSTTDDTTDEIDDAPSNATQSFDIEEAGSSDELEVNSSDNDPDATTLELQDDEKSDWLEVFVFGLSAEDSDNDVEVNDLPVSLVFPDGGSYSGLISDAQLMIDGESFDDFTVASSSTNANLTFEFDSGELVVAAGEEVEVSLQLEFNQLAAADEGKTLYSTTSASQIDAEGADDLSGSQLSGSATSETHTLRTTGLSIDMTDSTFDANNNSDTPSESYGEFTVELELTAVGDDVYVPETADRDASSTVGVAFQVEDSNGAVISTGATTESFQRSSGGTLESSGRYKISEGSSATFELTVTFDPALATGEGQFQIQILTVGFNDSDALPDTTQTASPAGDFESDQGFIDN